MKPIIAQNSNKEFYLVGQEVIKLKAVSLISALREALLIEPNLDKTSWINEENKTVPILFKV